MNLSKEKVMNYKVAGKLFGLALFSLTLAAIVYYPALDAAVIRQPCLLYTSPSPRDS